MKTSLRRRHQIVVLSLVTGIFVFNVLDGADEHHHQTSFLASIVGSNHYRWLKDDDDDDAKDNKTKQSTIQQPMSLAELYRDDGEHQIARDYKLIYCHVPKSGGSTMEASTIFDEKRRVGKIPPSSHRNIRYMIKDVGSTTDDTSISPSRTWDDPRQLDGFLTAAHIRHPCDRFLSAFYYTTQDDRSMGIRKTVTDMGMMKHSTVESFLDWLEEKPVGRWTKLKRRIFHFQPMVSWLLLEDDTFGIDEVLCQESWEEGIIRLFHRLNQTTSTRGNIDVTIPNEVLHHKVRSNPNHPTCDQLDPKYRQMILREYATDQCLFDYKEIRRDMEETNNSDDSSTCIGTGKDRAWFTDRWKYCKEHVLDNRLVKELSFGSPNHNGRGKVYRTKTK